MPREKRRSKDDVLTNEGIARVKRLLGSRRDRRGCKRWSTKVAA
jgi:hypothetical protein